MPDNVIVLGAGASFDAGIPLLAHFVERMLEFAYKGTIDNKPLSETDKQIFEKVSNIRRELDSYHGRANFDDRNLEDILSILSFNVLSGDDPAEEKLKELIKAIARTIELTCTVKHDGTVNRIQEIGPNIYRDFWSKLFERFADPAAFPTIITFNYDLVLERALFQLLINKHYDGHKKRFPFGGVKLNYCYGEMEALAYKIDYIRYEKADFETFPGTTLRPCKPDELQNAPTIELLKLHGSVNFPVQKPMDHTEKPPTNMVDDPYILPPIFNKLMIGAAKETWKTALLRLRSAKNVVVVGYSLPRTDIYMQYFLKAALGPNVTLNRLFIFNPILYGKGQQASDEMKDRYGSCFSQGLTRHIVFQPGFIANLELGTFEHFVKMITMTDEKHKIFY